MNNHKGYDMNNGLVRVRKVGFSATKAHNVQFSFSVNTIQGK